MKEYYKVQYNSTTKTWNLFKYIEGDYSFNFYSILESENKKDCQDKLKELMKGK